MTLRTLDIDPNGRSFSVSLAGRLTCICPVNERRDYATVEVSYVPVARVVELESFARYLSHWSETQGLHEVVTTEIAEEVQRATEADDITVRTRWDAIEGVECVVTTHR